MKTQQLDSGRARGHWVRVLVALTVVLSTTSGRAANTEAPREEAMLYFGALATAKGAATHAVGGVGVKLEPGASALMHLRVELNRLGRREGRPRGRGRDPADRAPFTGERRRLRTRPGHARGDSPDSRFRWCSRQFPWIDARAVR